MEDPVMDLCGHSFERRAIEAWLCRGNACCPISQKELTLENLTPNDALAERIEKWTWEKEHAAEMMMILQTLSEEEHSSTDNSDEEGDIELGEFGIFRIPTKSAQYASVASSANTTRSMLLPQEREALEAIHQRNLILKQRRKRRKTFYVSCGIVMTILMMGAMGLYWVYMF